MIPGLTAGGKNITVETGTPMVRADRIYTFDNDEGKLLAGKAGFTRQTQADSTAGTTVAGRMLSIGNGGSTNASLTVDADSMVVRYKVSSEVYDKFRIYVDEVLKHTDAGNTGAFEEINLVLGGGPRVVRFNYYKDGSSAVGSDTVFISQLRLVNAMPVIKSVVKATYNFEAGMPAIFAPATAAGWYIAPKAYAGIGTTQALRGADIGDGGTTQFVVGFPDDLWLEAVGTASSETPDRGRFLVDGVERVSVSGTAQYTAAFPLGTGAKNVTFRFTKDASLSSADDTVYISQVTAIREGP